MPASQAVRNRRGLLADEIMQVIERNHGKPGRVTSLASGPALELFDVLDRIDDPSRLEATLIDIDLQALAFVSDKLARQKLERQWNLVHANLVYLATGKHSIDLADQDLGMSRPLLNLVG